MEMEKNKYPSHVFYSESLNAAIFEVFSEYFNTLKSDYKIQQEQGIEIIGFIENKSFVDTVRLAERYNRYEIIVKFDGIYIIFSFEVFKESNKVYYQLDIRSNVETLFKSDSIYKMFFYNAIRCSELKGAVFSLERNQIIWSKIDIQKRTFDDLFLPNKNIDDLHLYIKSAIDTGELMRFLMVGNPGTGKTEATTVLANLMNKEGITVIKTVVCDEIKSKFELASILAPSIVILDDIDLSIGARNKGVFPERLQDFLDILDGAVKLDKRVGIIATTNSTALLDMAAQRPGRFDKIILFNKLTKSNVKNIIIKSLKDNFPTDNQDKIIKLFSDNKIVNSLFSNSVTGAYIYNTIKMIKLKIDAFKIGDKANVNWVLSEIKSNLETIDKAKNADFLNDRMNSGGGGIGFQNNNDEEDEEDEEDDEGYDHPLTAIKEMCGDETSSSRTRRENR